MFLGLQRVLYLGNLDSQRDWGDARDYVKAMWKMLQADTAEDYVIATGVSHSVREFVERAFEEVGIEIEWKGSGVGESGVIKRISATDLGSQELKPTPLKVGDVVVKIDPGYFRPTEVDFLLGDATKAREKLGWKPTITFEKLVRSMVRADIREAMAEDLCRREGFSAYNHFE
jgi:GDPmannose 4,6-dehydratase